MDSHSMRMLHLYILDHFRALGMHQTAEIFAREAGISSADSGLSLPDSFLRDWWCVFWDSYSSTMHPRSTVGEDVPVSSAQTQALSQIQPQAQAQAQAETQPMIQAQAQAQVPYQVQAQARAEAEIQAHAWALANSGMLGSEPYVNTLEQLWAQPNYVNNASMLSEPILASTWNDGQHGALPPLPCYINTDFQPGWAFPEPSRNPRHGTNQISRRSRRQATGIRSWRGNASNPAKP